MCRVVKHHADGKKVIAVAYYNLWASCMFNNDVYLLCLVCCAALSTQSKHPNENPRPLKLSDEDTACDALDPLLTSFFLHVVIGDVCPIIYPENVVRFLSFKHIVETGCPNEHQTVPLST